MQSFCINKDHGLDPSYCTHHDCDWLWTSKASTYIQVRGWASTLLNFRVACGEWNSCCRLYLELGIMCGVCMCAWVEEEEEEEARYIYIYHLHRCSYPFNVNVASLKICSCDNPMRGSGSYVACSLSPSLCHVLFFFMLPISAVYLLVRHFIQHVNFSINMISEGRLVFRTVRESHIADVLPDNDGKS